MDDVSSRLKDILGDPGSMEKIRNLAAMLGSSGGESEQENSHPPKEEPEHTRKEPTVPGADAELMRTVMRLAPLLSHARQENDSTRLLRALRPFLSEKRRKKLDEALRLLQLARALPYLKGSGVLNGLFSVDG